MKAGIAVLLNISALSLITMSPLPCFAQGNSYSGTTTITAPVNSNSSASSQPETTTTTTTTTVENSGSSWRQSVRDAARNTEVATENVYNQVARNVKDISLEARIKAVLHEDKSTRDSDVHVTADDGIVTLTGVVPSEQNAQRVQEVVASIYGVEAVSNNLNYPHSGGVATPPDADSTGIVHPAYSDTAPAENAPIN
jgi:osmotically-inducible protein OsmY